MNNLFLDEPLPIQMPGEPFRAPGLIPPQRRVSRAAEILAANGPGGAGPMTPSPSLGGYRLPAHAGGTMGFGPAGSPAAAPASALTALAAPQWQRSGNFGGGYGPSLFGQMFAGNGGTKASFMGDLGKPDAAAGGGFADWFSSLFSGMKG